MPIGKRTLRTLQILTFPLLSAALIQAEPVHAATSNPPPAVYLNGHSLAFPVQPIIEEGFCLVPMRAIFEAEGAKVDWDQSTGTVTAVKDGTTLTYRIGERVAYKNLEPLTMPIPGQVIDGTTLVPLRFVSETLGNLVKWHAYARSVTISTSRDFETAVEYGVNLRDAPDKDADAGILRMLSKNERIHVIREVDPYWLEVQTKDDEIGFISAKPMYTDYASESLAAKQGEELLAFGSKYIGTPYEFGADSGQTDTFDCSSFVRYVYQEVLSVDLPRVSYEQAKAGTEVGLDQLRPGDLLFFSARGLDIGHVAIYAGNGRVLHTYSKERGVHFMDLDDAWRKRLVTARRVF